MPDTTPSSARRRKVSGPLSGVLALVAVVFAVYTATGNSALLDAVSDFGGGSGDPEAAGNGGSVSREETDEALERLEEIEVAGPEPRGDYERDEFGSSWVDTAGNGCSTRHDILARDLEKVDTADGCTVLSGTFDDPYTGERIEFTAEDPQAVQIDHVVPLSLAWRMGAADWERDRRVEFANDPRNLLATDGPANMEKSDSGPGEWQPYEGYRCSYAVGYIDVTYHYELPLPPEDHEGLEEMLDTCA